MTLASKITLVRVAMIPAFMVTMYLSGGAPGMWMYVSLAIFIIASLTDSLDGYIARHYNQVTDFGKFLDPLADKLLVIAAMCMFCLSVYLSVREAVTTAFLHIVQNVGYAIVNVLGWIAVVLRKERVFLRTLFQIHLYRSLEMVCSFHIAVVFMSCQIVCFKISLQ